VVVALAAPPSVTVTPDPLAAGLIVPEILYVGGGPVEVVVEAVKFTPVTLAPLTVTDELDGLKLNPLLVALMVYELLLRPVKL
jgi:hypothetical protein